MKKIKIKKLIYIILIIIMFGCRKNKKNVIPAVNNFDLKNYMGKWYEIARYPHFFEKDLDSVTAEYSILENGKIEVINSGRKPDGKFKSVKGKAKIIDKAGKGILKVSFFPLIWSEYRIIDLDSEEYSYAVVTSGYKRKYFWILSRKPFMDKNLYNQLIKKAVKWGFDKNKILKIKHQNKN